MTPPPFLFRVYTLLSAAQYAAANSARDNRAASPEVAVASASAAVLTEMFTDSTVRASIARELARDIAQAVPDLVPQNARSPAKLWEKTSPVA